MNQSTAKHNLMAAALAAAQAANVTQADNDVAACMYPAAICQSDRYLVFTHHICLQRDWAQGDLSIWCSIFMYVGTRSGSGRRGSNTMKVP